MELIIKKKVFHFINEIERKLKMATSMRQLSTTARRSGIMDILKFYKKSEPAVPTKSTEEVMKAATSQNELDSKPPSSNKVEIIGRRHPSHFDPEVKARKLNGFVVHRWIPKDNKYIQSVDSSTEDYQLTIKSLLDSTFKSSGLEKDTQLDDLLKRFSLLKSVQKTFGVQIPDVSISKLSNFSQIESYLVKALDPEAQFTNKSEFTPDAVDFNEADFEGTNISVGEFVFESEKKKMYKKLTVKAKKIEEQNTKSYLSQSSA